ncbi:MAG: hypothetical protein P8X51_17110 [Maritimibacter sp.]
MASCDLEKPGIVKALGAIVPAAEVAGVADLRPMIGSPINGRGPRTQIVLGAIIMLISGFLGGSKKS